MVSTDARRVTPGRVALGVAALAVLVVAALAARSVTVLDKGQLLPYTEGTIYLLQVFGVRFYLEPEQGPSLDWFNAAALFMVSGMAALSWLVLRGRGATQLVRFYLLTALGTLWLGLDELIGIHESIGHNAQWLASLPGVGHPDDAVIILYGICALLFVVAFHRVLLQRRSTLVLWGIGVACFALAALSDALSIPGEELLELATTACLVAGFLGLTAGQFRPADTAVDPRGTAAGAGRAAARV